MAQWTAEQCTKAQLAGLEVLVGLTNKALEGFEKVMELNLQTMKTSLAQTREGVMKALSVQNPQELVELQIELFQPATDKALAYRRQLFDILAATRADFDKVVEVQYTAGKQGLQDFLEKVENSAPSGSTAPLAAWQEALKATTMFYESVQSTARQTVEVAENSLNTAAAAASKGARHRVAQASASAAAK
ncbi:phasin family protein [Cupriavidus sp. WKF15]|uniref:phasin family protein n=1 Tax=Cupriavidus sp. WKF15 TaxID=3032282 RepID=UPI0023E2248D|nr:phasin family protein [Cupriavidus sp. WKF15]WER47982.1 phasin family protein [Cupriavidus sp. WKF15]